MAAPRNSAESDKAIVESQEMTCCSIPPPPTDFSSLSPHPWSPTKLPWSPSYLSQSTTDVPLSPPLPFSQSPPLPILPSNQSIEIPQFQQHEDLVFDEIISSLCLRLQNMQLLPQTLHEVSPQQLPDLLAKRLAQQLLPQLPPQQLSPLRQLRQWEKLEFLLLLELLHQLLRPPLILQSKIDAISLSPGLLKMGMNMIEHISWGLFRTPALPPIIKTKLYKGVWQRQDGEWVAKIRHHKKWVNIGTFNTAKEAAVAHDRAAYMLRGRLARINFPELVGVSHNFLDKNRAEPTAAAIMEILSPPTQQEDNPGDDSVLWWSKATGNDEIEAVGIEGEGRRDDEMNSGLEKGKRKVKTAREEREAKKGGVRIEIPLEDIRQRKGMSIVDAAKDLTVSKSTLKRACREYGIRRWPPRENKELISNSLPTENPMDLDQEQVPQSSSHILPPYNQALPIVNADSVLVKARHENGITIKFRLSSPWRRVELNQQVEKRLELEAKTYYIQYKDEDNELILISGDDNVEECISNSRLIGANSIEVFLKPRQPI